VKVVPWSIGGLTLLGSGGYLFVYVYRWEWHRALLVGVLFLSAVVAMCTALLLLRLSELQRSLRTPTAEGELGALHQLKAAPHDAPPFPWLRPEALERTHIFIPVLLGGGVVISGAAWLLERIAGRSAREGVERELAHDLGLIGFPMCPLVPGEAEALAGDAAFADRPGVRMLLGPDRTAA
jgi:hypothetical protein